MSMPPYTDEEIAEFAACKSYEEFAALQEAKREKEKAESWRVVRRSEWRRSLLWWGEYIQFLDLEKPDGTLCVRHTYPDKYISDPCEGKSWTLNYGDEQEMMAEFMSLSGYDLHAREKWKKRQKEKEIGDGPDTYEAHI